MRYDEIREWLRVLSTDTRYGWAPKGVRGLERALGMMKQGITWKLEDHRWIWPSEQYRLTARINDILEGHIIPKLVRNAHTGRNTIEGVYVDPPQPPPVPKPRMLCLYAAPGKISFQPTAPAAPRMPAFREAFEKIAIWNPFNDKRP
jgi:hypothetical protein